MKGLILAALMGVLVDPTYFRDVKPVIDSQCAGCHAAKNLKEVDVSGGVALDSFESIMKAGVLVPRDAPGSEMVSRLREKDADSRMPREAAALPEETIVLIERWIAAGAERGDPATAPPAPAPAPPPRFRPARPLDVRIPTTLAITGTPPPIEFRVKIGPLPPVSALAFGAGGSAGLLAAGGHGTVTVWDLSLGRAVRVLTGVRGTIHAVRFSPDGSLLAVGGGYPGEKGVAAVHEWPSWKEVHRLEGHGEVVLALAFSPDGSRLATASLDKVVRVWDLKAGKEAFTVREHSDAVQAVAFIEGGKFLASAGSDRSVKLTDLASGKVVRSLAGHDQPVLALAASPAPGPDGATLVSAGLEPALRFWGSPGWKTLRQAAGHGGRVEDVAFSRDGKRLASVGSDRKVRLWEADGKKLRSLAGGSEWLYSVDFDAPGRRVAAGAWDGTLRVWEVESGREVAVLLQPPAADEAALDWALATPEGYFDASEALWDLLQEPLRRLGPRIRDRERIRRSLGGEAPPPPRLGRERAF